MSATVKFRQTFFFKLFLVAVCLEGVHAALLLIFPALRHNAGPHPAALWVLYWAEFAAVVVTLIIGGGSIVYNPALLDTESAIDIFPRFEANQATAAEDEPNWPNWKLVAVCLVIVGMAAFAIWPLSMPI